MKTEVLTIDPAQTLLQKHKREFEILARLLVEENKKINLTRITDPVQIQSRHFLDSLMAVSILDQLAEQVDSIKVADVGSGAGFPILPLAIVRPDWSFVSIEATGKKCVFQHRICKQLGLTNVEIIHARAEELAHLPNFRHRFTSVLTRALADLPILLEITLPLVMPKGHLLCWKGKTLTEELTRSENAFKRLSAQLAREYTYTLSQTAGDKTLPMFNLLSVKLTNKIPSQYPRPYGSIKKRPL